MPAPESGVRPIPPSQSAARSRPVWEEAGAWVGSLESLASCADPGGELLSGPARTKAASPRRSTRCLLLRKEQYSAPYSAVPFLTALLSGQCGFDNAQNPVAHSLQSRGINIDSVD